MRARNKQTGSPIVKIFERYIATSRVELNSFQRDRDGSLAFELTNEGSEIDWNLGEQDCDEQGRPLYTDLAGDIVAECDIELYDAGVSQ